MLKIIEVGRFDADADAAIEEIGKLCEAAGGEGEEIVVYEAGDYYAAEGAEATVERLGITAPSLSSAGTKHPSTASTRPRVAKTVS